MNNKKHLKQLILQTQNNNINASKELIILFKPLVLSLCNTIHTQMSDLVSFNDLLENANQFLLTFFVDQTNFNEPLKGIKSYVYYNLITCARFIVVHRKRLNTEIHEFQDNYTALDDLLYNEQREYVAKLNDFMWKEFTEQELGVIITHVIGEIPLQELVPVYNLCISRLYQIKKDCLFKLKEHLYTLNIKRLGDL